LLLLCSISFTAQAQNHSALVLAQTVPLPGVRGRFDHFAIDETGRRLFVAALGNNTVEVIDLAAGKRMKSVSGMSRPTGLTYLAEPNQLWVANGGDGTLKILDGSDFSVVKTLTGLDDADNLRFDSKTKSSWLGHGDGALAIFNATDTGRNPASIRLPAHPESFQLEQSGNRIFVNLPDVRQVTVIDREKQTVTKIWPMEKFRANFPMALDQANDRLFIGCRSPARLVVLDTTSGNMVADLEISGDTDDLFYDAARSQIYLACGEGFINVVRQVNPDKYELRQKIPTRTGARTGFFSSELTRFYLAVPQGGVESAELRIFKVGS